MLAAGDLQPPVGYDDRWLPLALAAVALVAAYYVAVLWWTRPRTSVPRASAWTQRDRCLAELTRIEDAVASRAVSPRVAHQQLSRAVREFVAATSDVPAATMTLTTLRGEGPAPLAELVTVLYPPEFGPDEERTGREFLQALDQARTLVATWS